MLPHVDSIQTGATGAAQSVRHESDLVVHKAAEAYREAADDAAEAERGARVERSAAAVPVEPGAPVAEAYAPRDEARFTFRVTPEERDALVTAFSRPEGAESLTKEEKTTLQGVAERIASLAEQAAARNAGSREKTEKALAEWYTRLSQGEKPPTDLLDLLRQAAMGAFDDIHAG